MFEMIGATGQLLIGETMNDSDRDGNPARQW